jgi:hypothetical protein
MKHFVIYKNIKNITKGNLLILTANFDCSKNYRYRVGKPLFFDNNGLITTDGVYEIENSKIVILPSRHTNGLLGFECPRKSLHKLPKRGAVSLLDLA